MKQLFERVAHWMRQPPVSKLLGMLMSVIAVCIGASMILAPNSYLHPPVFSAAMELASPPFWGMLYLLGGAVLAAAILKDRTQAQIPALVLGALHCLFAALSVASEQATPINLITFSGLGLVCVITQLSCGAEEPEHE